MTKTRPNIKQKTNPPEQIIIYLLRNLDTEQFYCNYSNRKGRLWNMDSCWTNNIQKCSKWFNYQGPSCAKAWVEKEYQKDIRYLNTPNMEIVVLPILIDITDNKIVSSIYPRKY